MLMSHRGAPCFCLLVGGLLGLGALAQEKAAAQKKDPQSAMEPRSGPGAGQELLKKFVGHWDVVKTFYPRSGEPARSGGTCKQSLIHGGRFLQSDFVFSPGDSQTTGLGLIGFETTTGLFTSVWTDSRATRMSFRQSQEKFNGKEIVLFGRSLDADADADSPRRSRTVTRMENDSNKIVHRQFSIAADGSERLVMELVMTRKAK